MSSTLSILSPIFGLLAVGFAAARTGLLSPEGVRGIVKLVSGIAIPALLFRALATSGAGATERIDIAIVYFVGCAVLLTAGFLVARLALRLDAAECGVFSMGAVYSNSSLLGVPIAQALLGHQGLVLLTKIIAFHSLILIPASTLLVAFGVGANRGRIWQIFLTAMGNPMVLGLTAGVIWAQTGIALPAVVDSMTQALSEAASPTALIALGATIARVTLPEKFGAPLLSAGLKLVVHPLLVWLIAHALGLPREATLIATVTAALPPGVNVYLMATHFDRYADDTARAFALATALSAFSITFVIQALNSNS